VHPTGHRPPGRDPEPLVEIYRSGNPGKAVHLLTDLVTAETIFVLESFYEAPRDEVA
jgi:hypothetical protein